MALVLRMLLITMTAAEEFCKGKDDGYFADPKNCIKYYHCTKGVGEHITCPLANGKQECYDKKETWCDWPERVNCCNRPICDKNDEKCNENNEDCVEAPTTPTTTAPNDKCSKHGGCTMNQDGMGPYKTEGPCERCFCQCVAAGYYIEEKCGPGLVFNKAYEQCDFPYNMPDCQ